ncbi:MAG: hydrogenase iron-sulfur subunit [Candidatus Acetothermia bacterium]
MTVEFEPKLVGFLCKWCSSAGADLAGVSRKSYPANLIPVTVNCSGRIEASHVIRAFRDGADGVLISGCHPGDCHYTSGNYKTGRRVALLKHVLEDFGMNPERIRLEWISATEGEEFARTVRDFTGQIRELGPGPYRDAKKRE